eukprot:TRINITY_DN2649_c1_g1_i1.p1 TRINITY_DN2649_c1_g1~~TRINITY_DN2649_c1_g1_i1.p1  ORF type:complete len:161 (-),score=40.97 TRINITY_DN2649_c1_g1_i1:66-548(-)
MNKLVVVGERKGKRSDKKNYNLQNQKLKDIINHFNEISLICSNDSSFQLIVSPSEGYWKQTNFKFEINSVTDETDSNFKVRSMTIPLYHPNIKSDGTVKLRNENNSDLNLLLEDLQYLFKQHPYMSTNNNNNNNGDDSNMILIRDEKILCAYKFNEKKLS